MLEEKDKNDCRILAAVNVSRGVTVSFSGNFYSTNALKI